MHEADLLTYPSSLPGMPGEKAGLAPGKEPQGAGQQPLQSLLRSSLPLSQCVRLARYSRDENTPCFSQDE